MSMSLDMKSGLIAGLYAIHAVREAYGPLRGDLVFESVIEEECSGNGTLAARRHGPHVDAAIIPEISGEDVQIANPGVLWFEVTVTGKPAYVGLAGASVNAIDVAMDVIAGLEQLPADLNAQFSYPAYAAYDAPLALNVGTISGGDWPSNVPLECKIGFRLAYPLQWSVQQGQACVAKRLDEISAAHQWLRERPPVLRWHGFGPTASASLWTNRSSRRGRRELPPGCPRTRTHDHRLVRLTPCPGRFGTVASLCIHMHRSSEARCSPRLSCTGTGPKAFSPSRGC
jgi:acetylornithine deacetylase/succinyl-diaminopimelate desuccinylase-like protein